MISKFDEWKLKKGKPLGVNKQRLCALKFILGETVKSTLDGATLGAILTVKEEVQDEVTEQDINEMVQSFDKAWTKFHNEWGSSLDNAEVNER
jgi:hypothetical protein